jgi:hypothetical protein
MEEMRRLAYFADEFDEDGGLRVFVLSCMVQRVFTTKTQRHKDNIAIL